MSKRRKVARRSNRTARGNHRMHSCVEHREQRINDFNAAPGVTFRKHVCALNHHRSNNAFRKRLADATRMRTHKIDLKLAQLLMWNRDIRKRAKAGIDAVDRFTPRYDVLHKATRSRYSASRSLSERHLGAVCDRSGLFEGKRPTIDLYHFG
jgi:hypothetical protein